jgi:hypothetical protein
VNNEPVFWTCGLEEDEAVSNAIKIKLELEYYNIPLYTHPAKTLTDEEIIEVHVNTPFIDGYLNKNLIAFARAILRKAQEK